MKTGRSITDLARGPAFPFALGEPIMFVSRNDRFKALAQAQANADWTGVTWVVFSDTCGNWHCERQSTGPKNVDVEIVHPRPQAEENHP